MSAGMSCMSLDGVSGGGDGDGDGDAAARKAAKAEKGAFFYLRVASLSVMFYLLISVPFFYLYVLLFFSVML